MRYVIVTDGAFGSADPDMTRERLAALRRDEQLKGGDKRRVL